MTKPLSNEYWLRGPVPGVLPLLQPVAHALLQAREEVNVLMKGFPDQRLWDRPAGLASPGFHLQHLAGVLDRLFTYARGEGLSPEQLDELAGEGRPGPGPGDQPLNRFNSQIDKALQQLGQTSEGTLTQARVVGRRQIPSTVIGLLFHAAEHTMRHTGQLLVTTRILRASPPAGNRGE
jgi:uncharacterized damage-inducible protein DinB